ncbi:MAG: hypothetical protein WCP20_08195 [Desulfuromonadales bacterium]
MSGTLSSSPRKNDFDNYLRLNNKLEKIESFRESIDNLCLEISKQKFRGTPENQAFDQLCKIALELHSKEQFFEFFSSRTFSKHYKENKKGDNLKEAYKALFEFLYIRTTEESFASYMVGRYRLGYEYLARYWAAILFEQIIERKARLLDGDAWLNKRKGFQITCSRCDKPLLDKKLSGEDPTLDHNINLLSKDTLNNDSIYKFRKDIFTHYYDKNTQNNMEKYPLIEVEHVRKRLLNFKKLRNEIMHDVIQKESMPGSSQDLIYYVWSELLPELFQHYRDKQKEKGASSIIESISEAEADYLVRAVDETTKKEKKEQKFEEIKRHCFEDLYEMRKALLSLRSLLNKWELLNSVGLTTDILTTIDTASAYIWMPLVPRDMKVAKSQGIYNCAVSILVTPLDFRVYMDFGGYADEERFAYYQFLESEDYYNIMETFNGKEEMEAFDIDWFSFITRRSKLESPGAVDVKNIVSAKRKLSVADTPITWNRMLHGYILTKDNVPKDGITLEWITERLGWIIQFYQKFKEFKQPMTLEDYKKKWMVKK